MKIQVDAIFENGVFHPATPVQLGEGSRVALDITIATEVESTAPPPERAAAALAEIAALPRQGHGDAH